MKSKGKKKSLVGYILKKEKINSVLIKDNGFIVIDDNFSPATNKRYIDATLHQDWKKVRITIEELE
jgi:hypothetical protein